MAILAFHNELYFTNQALSFDTYIEEVVIKYVIRHLVVAAILDLQ